MHSMETDGATKHPTTASEKLRFGLALLLSVGGQTLQNIAVPMFLSEGIDDTGVMLVYTTFIYFMFFTLLDLVLGFFTPRNQQITLDMDHKRMAWVGVLNALCGVGVLFGGDPARTPLPLQMTFFLLCNQLAPVYKVLRRYGFHRGHIKAVISGAGKRGAAMLGIATISYTVAMVLVLSDDMSNSTGGTSISPFCLFFIFGTMAAMMYNVDQDAVMGDTRTIVVLSGEPISHEQLSFFMHFRRDVATLRYQTTWLFIAGWIGPLVSLAGGNEVPLTSELFNSSWANLLPFSNLWINVLNGAYILTFIGNIYINRFDSAFTMIVTNVSSVSSMWTGWVPSMMARTVGFVPSYARIIPAMIISVVAILPSWEFSKEFRCGLKEGDRSVQKDDTVRVHDHLLKGHDDEKSLSYINQ